MCAILCCAKLFLSSIMRAMKLLESSQTKKKTKQKRDITAANGYARRGFPNINTRIHLAVYSFTFDIYGFSDSDS